MDKNVNVLVYRIFEGYQEFHLAKVNLRLLKIEKNSLIKRI